MAVVALAALFPSATVVACTEGATPDCTDAAAQCAPLISAPEAGQPLVEAGEEAGDAADASDAVDDADASDAADGG